MLLKKFAQKINTHRSIIYVILLCSCIVLFKCSRSAEMSRIPARAFLYPDEKPNSNYPIIGYLLFTHRPDSVESIRYEKIFNSYINNFEMSSYYEKMGEKDLAVTYWLLTKRGYVNDNIKYYDYARAQIICSKINQLGEKGPILVAFNNYNNAVPSNAVLLLNLSNFADNDIDRAFRIWKERIVLEPEKWKTGFELVILKEEFRNLIQSYGSQIIAVIGKIFDIAL